MKYTNKQIKEATEHHANTMTAYNVDFDKVLPLIEYMRSEGWKVVEESLSMDHTGPLIFVHFYAVKDQAVIRVGPCQSSEKKFEAHPIYSIDRKENRKLMDYKHHSPIYIYGHSTSFALDRCATNAKAVFNQIMRKCVTDEIQEAVKIVKKASEESDKREDKREATRQRFNNKFNGRNYGEDKAILELNGSKSQEIEIGHNGDKVYMNLSVDVATAEKILFILEEVK